MLPLRVRSSYKLMTVAHGWRGQSQLVAFSTIFFNTSKWSLPSQRGSNINRREPLSDCRMGLSFVCIDQDSWQDEMAEMIEKTSKNLP